MLVTSRSLRYARKTVVFDDSGTVNGARAVPGDICSRRGNAKHSPTKSGDQWNERERDRHGARLQSDARVKHKDKGNIIALISILLSRTLESLGLLKQV